MKSKVQQDQQDWRRDKVIELSSQGFNQSEMASTLQVTRSVISKDVAYLKERARVNLERHIQETIPHEHEKSNVAIDQVLRMCWTIVNKTNDDKTKLQALSLIKDCRKYKDELATDQSSIIDAIRYINQKTEQLNTLKVLDERIEEIDIDVNNNNKIQKSEEATASGVL